MGPVPYTYGDGPEEAVFSRRRPMCRSSSVRGRETMCVTRSSSEHGGDGGDEHGGDGGGEHGGDGGGGRGDDGGDEHGDDGGGEHGGDGGGGTFARPPPLPPRRPPLPLPLPFAAVPPSAAPSPRLLCFFA